MVTYFLSDSSNSAVNGEVRNAMIGNRAIQNNMQQTQLPTANMGQTQLQNGGMQHYTQNNPSADYYQKQTQFQDNNYHMNMNSDTYNIKKDNYASYNSIESNKNSMQEEQQQLLLHHQQHLQQPQPNYNHLQQQQQQRLNSKLQKQPFLSNGGLPSLRENGHNGEHSNGYMGYNDYAQQYANNFAPHHAIRNTPGGLPVMREQFNIIENPNGVNSRQNSVDCFDQVENFNNLYGNGVGNGRLDKHVSNRNYHYMNHLNNHHNNQQPYHSTSYSTNSNSNNYNNCRESEPLLHAGAPNAKVSDCESSSDWESDLEFDYRWHEEILM